MDPIKFFAKLDLRPACQSFKTGYFNPELSENLFFSKEVYFEALIMFKEKTHESSKRSPVFPFNIKTFYMVFYNPNIIFEYFNVKFNYNAQP
jgi:hypothetical protein